MANNTQLLSAYVCVNLFSQLSLLRNADAKLKLRKKLKLKTD